MSPRSWWRKLRIACNTSCLRRRGMCQLIVIWRIKLADIMLGSRRWSGQKCRARDPFSCCGVRFTQRLYILRGHLTVPVQVNTPSLPNDGTLSSSCRRPRRCRACPLARGQRWWTWWRGLPTDANTSVWPCRRFPRTTRGCRGRRSRTTEPMSIKCTVYPRGTGAGRVWRSSALAPSCARARIECRRV